MGIICLRLDNLGPCYMFSHIQTYKIIIYFGCLSVKILCIPNHSYHANGMML